MPTKLEPITVPLSSLYLDPNNPRFADNKESNNFTRREKVHEEAVQNKAMKTMLGGSYDVSELKQSIAKIGFVLVDQLVVVELPQQGKYMVIEGNRRLASLKSLAEDEEVGDIDPLSEEVKESITNIPVLVITGGDEKEREHFARILQGVRHVSSVKPWGPYQQAEIVAMMFEDGQGIPTIRETLGLSSQRVNSLKRSYFGLRQMQKDVDYGGKAVPKLFSHFEEAYKQAKLRQWLEWDDNTNEYLNETNRKMFYSWCLEYEEDDEKYEPKIKDAKELRDIGTLMGNPALFQQFCVSPSLRLPNALKGAVEPAEEMPIDWQADLDGCVKALNKIPAYALRSATDEDTKRLESIMSTCQDFLQQIKFIQRDTSQ